MLIIDEKKYIVDEIETHNQKLSKSHDLFLMEKLDEDDYAAVQGSSCRG